MLNIAAYKFAPLSELKSLRERLLVQCKAGQLKGTILLSTEGINLFVAGEREPIEALLAELRAIPGLQGLTPKISESDHQPFNRMLVRIKKEIIAFGVPGIDPARRAAPKIAPRELKQWLDEGRPVTLLDTRNNYEVKLGTFRNAVVADIDHFREFPAAVAKLPDDLKRQPIVMFCTGGIRCEKAGPYMTGQGFENVLQLDGGILKYFEDCGGAHYDGECFVFDQRVGLDPSLSETTSDQCFACQSPLTEEDQQDARYAPGKSCPYCYRTSDEQLAETIRRREAALAKLTAVLPGSVPYENRRPLDVAQRFDRATLLEFLTGILPHVPSEEWQTICAAGRMVDRQGSPAAAETIVRAGDRFWHVLPGTREPDVATDIRIVFEDNALIVLLKPAPLPLHPSGRFHRNTLQYFLHEVYRPQRPRPCHRLDANTSGLVVFARSRHLANLVQSQFARSEVEKLYLARVQGHPTEDTFACDLPISDVAGEIGSRTVDEEAGLPARTEFQVLERFRDGTSLLEVRPITGRTNQIRVHLWQLELPICGEQMYLAGRQFGRTQTHAVGDPPLCLQAHKIALCHPLTHQRIEFETRLPSWASFPGTTP